MDKNVKRTLIISEDEYGNTVCSTTDNFNCIALYGCAYKRDAWLRFSEACKVNPDVDVIAIYFEFKNVNRSDNENNELDCIILKKTDYADEKRSELDWNIYCDICGVNRNSDEIVIYFDTKDVETRMFER